MKKEITFCDRCKCELEKASTMRIVTSRSQDVSGNGYEDDSECIDTCLDCLQAWLRSEMKRGGYDAGKRFIEFISRGITK